MLQINVAQLLKAPIGEVREYDIEGVVNIVESKNSPVRGNVKLTRTPRSILVRGEVEAEVEVTCSRCLRPFTCPLRFSFDEEYFPSIDVVSGLPLPKPDEPGSFFIDEHHILDLTEAIRQYAVMTISMKPLCQEDCAGICPTCGRNLNEGPCGCPVERVDPRWAALRKLK